MRRLALIASMLLAVVGGVAGASVVSGAVDANTPGEPTPVETAASDDRGASTADPRGGPPWAVRILDGDSDRRCITVGRTDGRAFGPVDANGRVIDTDAVITGACADPAADPLQLAVAGYGDSGGQGPRSVLFGIVAANVRSVLVTGPGGPGRVSPDGDRTFVIVAEGDLPATVWTVTVTLADGTSRVYHPGSPISGT
jgi:hypothetical protein